MPATGHNVGLVRSFVRTCGSSGGNGVLFALCIAFTAMLRVSSGDGVRICCARPALGLPLGVTGAAGAAGSCTHSEVSQWRKPEGSVGCAA